MFSKKYKRHVSGAFVYIAIGLTATFLFSEAGGKTNSTAVNNETTPVDDRGGQNKTKGSGSLYIRRLILYTLDVIGATCNILLVIVLLFDPLKRLRKGAWITILNLAVADFIACVSSFLILGWVDFDVLYKKISQKTGTINIYNYFWHVGVAASFMFLTLLTIQIYVIIKWPMRRRALLTGPRIAVSCVIVWILAFLLAMFEMAYLWVNYGWEMRMAMVAVLELVIVLQVVVKILIIHEIVRSRLRSVANPENYNYQQREIAKTVVMLNAVLLLTALPYFAAKQYEFYQRLKREPRTHFPYYYEPIAMVNFVVNPILYSLRLPDFRNSLRALFCDCLCRKKRAPVGRPLLVQRSTTTTNV